MEVLGRRKRAGFRAEVHPHGARRARACAAAAARSRSRSEFHLPVEMGRRGRSPLRSRPAGSPPRRPTCASTVGLHRDRRQPPDLHAGRLRRRRHRPAARPRSSWLWATARRPLRTSTPPARRASGSRRGGASARRRQRAWPLARRTGRLGPGAARRRPGAAARGRRRSGRGGDGGRGNCRRHRPYPRSSHLRRGSC